MKPYTVEIVIKIINKYIEKNSIIIPSIYTHFNRNWGNGRKRGKFAIELDWSGVSPENHAGILAGEYGKKNITPRMIRPRSILQRGRGRGRRRGTTFRGRGKKYNRHKELQEVSN